MKKSLLLIVIACLALACDPPRWMNTHDVAWHVKNAGNLPIVFVTDSASYTIEPDDSLCLLYRMPFRADGEPEFSEIWQYVEEIGSRVSVTTEKGDLIMEWEKSEQYSDKSFYSENDWQKYRDFVTETKLRVRWIFVLE